MPQAEDHPVFGGFLRAPALNVRPQAITAEDGKHDGDQ